MRVLFVFPHPDDESFGPGPLLWKLRRTGHEAHLLTLTRGEATKQRERLGLTKEAMGEVRLAEMEDVARTLELASMEVLALPDGGLPDLDPRRLEALVEEHVARVQPHVLVTYAVHGISGHPDHLVSYAVVKRVFCAQRGHAGLQRLALFTLPPADDDRRAAHLKSSPWERISVVEPVSDEDLTRGHEALACYRTYQEVVKAHEPLAQVVRGVCFELFGETPPAPLHSLFDGLAGDDDVR